MNNDKWPPARTNFSKHPDGKQHSYLECPNRQFLTLPALGSHHPPRRHTLQNEVYSDDSKTSCRYYISRAVRFHGIIVIPRYCSKVISVSPRFQ